MNENPSFKSQYLQVLKEQEISTVGYIECRALRSTIITHCGMHSHASISRKSLAILVPVDMLPGACHSLYTSGIYITPFQHKILNLNINGTTYASLTELGVITDEGKCSGTSFTIDSITYLDSILTSHYTITVKQKASIYHHSTQSVKFSDGTSCSYSKGHCNIYENLVDPLAVITYKPFSTKV